PRRCPMKQQRPLAAESSTRRGTHRESGSHESGSAATPSAEPSRWGGPTLGNHHDHRCREPGKRPGLGLCHGRSELAEARLERSRKDTPGNRAVVAEVRARIDAMLDMYLAAGGLRR
ncbi:MAG TPA: hypothetical protein VN327_07170, partial [Pseudonocardiaceae bacterium]|nr:hypothetical protein [Pseudonocardiaceae bacterium]